MQDLTGHDIGRYHIVERLGEGGMATVYKAYDNRLERYVAIKVIRTDMFAPNVLEEVLKRFEREAKALARLAHPHIVKVHDFGDFDGTPYLIMEYLPGGTLKRYTGKPMPFAEASRLLAPIARALEYAHQQNIMHRDIKPANILITQSGQPMLTDFGIAKILEAGESTGLTASGVGIGTPEYMAPEQGMGGTVDTRADIYALGVVFYELITGRRPFSADTPMAVLVKHITEPLPSAHQFVSEVPEEVEAVIFKALAKQPAERYPDMGAFASALEHLAFSSATTAMRAEAPAVSLPPASPASSVQAPAAPEEVKPSIINEPASETVQVTAVAGGQAAARPASPASGDRTIIQPAPSPSAAAKAAPRKTNFALWIGLGGLVVFIVLILGGIKVLRNLRSARLAATNTVPVAVVATNAPLVPTKQPAATQAPLPTQTQPAQAPIESVDCARDDVFCVGLVANVASVYDRSFNQSTWEGIVSTRERLGTHVEFSNSKDSVEYAINIEKFAEAHYDMIVTVGFTMAESTTNAARKYPQITFIGVDQYQVEVLPNLIGIIFAEDNAGFLVGALAGMMTKSGKVGAVLGTDAVPAVWRFGEGYRAGVKYANPDAEALVIYHNQVDIVDSFNDPAWGADAANSLIIQGVDILFGAGGETGNGAIIAAAQRGIYVIGVDTDQYLAIPEVRSRILTSAVKQLGTSTFDLVRQAKNSKLLGGNYYGRAGYAPFHDLEDQIPTEVKNRLESIASQLNQGEIKTGVPEAKP